MYYFRSFHIYKIKREIKENTAFSHSKTQSHEHVLPTQTNSNLFSITCSASLSIWLKEIKI